MIVMSVLKFIFVIMLCIPVGYIILKLLAHLRSMLNARVETKKRRRGEGRR